MRERYKKIIEVITLTSIHVRSFYVRERDWYRRRDIRPAVLKYYRELRGILGKTSPKDRVLTGCIDCKIFFNRYSESRTE